MATLTKGKTFTSGETVTPTKLHELVDLGTVTNIVDADISASAGIAGSKLADSAVTTAKIADSAVTTAKINDTAVTQAKLAANVAGNGPAFYAFASGNTSVPNDSATKVTLAGERFDTNSCFASSRFTPNVEGYYQLSAGVWLGASGAAYLSAEIRKNGSTTNGIAGSQDNASDSRLSVVSGLIYFNGTTDYAELFCYQASGNTRTVTGGQSQTYFSGFLARAV